MPVVKHVGIQNCYIGMQVAYDCLMKAVATAKPGVRYREVGDIISKHAFANKMSVVRTYCGHGIGDLFHCAPNVPHFAKNKAKGIMQVCCCPFLASINSLRNVLKKAWIEAQWRFYDSMSTMCGLIKYQCPVLSITEF